MHRLTDIVEGVSAICESCGPVKIILMSNGVGRKANWRCRNAAEKKWKDRAKTPFYREYQRQYSAEYRARPEIKKKWKRYSEKHRFKKYGLTEEQYCSMVLGRDGKCDICGDRPEKRLKPDRLCVDHSHSSLEVRGLLCRQCNTVLGQVKDDPEILRRAIDYLTKASVLTAEARFGITGP